MDAIVADGLRKRYKTVQALDGARREIATADPLTSPGGISERIAGHRNAAC